MNSFNKIIKEYILHLKASGRNEATVENYSKKLTSFSKLLTTSNIHRITDTQVNKAIIQFQEGNPDKHPRSQTYMNQFKSVIRSFFTWCTATGRIDRDITIQEAINKSYNRMSKL